MALRVTVLCLDCDLVCGRVTTGGGAQLKRPLKHKQGRGKKTNWQETQFLRPTEANLTTGNTVKKGDLQQLQHNLAH